MKLVSFDIESYGELEEYALQPFRAQPHLRQAWLTSYAIASYDDEGRVVARGNLHPSVDELRLFLNNQVEEGATIVAWNAPFDVAWLIALGLREEVFRCKWLDAMLLWRHLTMKPDYANEGKRQSYGLKRAVEVYFPDEAGYDEGIQFGEVNEDLLIYNKKDAIHTLRLAQGFLSQMGDPLKRCAMIEASCIPMVAESIVQGLAVDTDAAQALDTKLDEEHKVAFVKLKLDAPEHVNEEVLASPAQLSNLLYDVWGLPAIKATAKGALSTDKEVLHELGLRDPRAALVRDYREAMGNRTKFVTNTLSSVEYNGDGCTRPQARIYGTYTGRMTYSSKQGKGKSERPTGVALHQWKRDPDFRRLIKAPDGHTLLEFDFAGQEFRWMAVEANDPTMLQLCQDGEDAHTYMGARIARIDYRKLMDDVANKVAGAKDMRQLGKVANLSLQYRTSGNRLMGVARTNYGLDMDINQAKAIHGTYQMAYRAVPKYWNSQIYKARKNGYVETKAGRRVYLGDGSNWDRDLAWSYESTSINFPIQGVGADQKYLALLILKNYLPSIEGRFYFELHDGLFVIVPDRYADKAVADIRKLLSNLPYKKAWGIDLPIQFPVDAKAGKSWGDLKEIK